MTLTPEQRLAGILVPVFALRAEDGDLGIGDTGCLRRFVDWAADAGFRLVQILPVNETGGDNSPYNAISSMALDPALLQLTPGANPDLTQEDFDAAVGAADPVFRDGSAVCYPVVKPLKQELLRRAHARFRQRPGAAGTGAGAGEAAGFAGFVRQQAGWLEDYALFRVLMDRAGGTECWDRWPEEHRSAAQARAWLQAAPDETRRAVEAESDFYRYVQWVAYGQWEDLKRHAEERGVALMGDIPFGVSYYSADYWARPDLFESGWSGGAPPESYFKDDQFAQKWGQNWGIPIYDWQKMRAENFAWWRQRVSGVRSLFHVFRIDHILGFYRIYSFPWRPEQNAAFLPLDAEQARARTGGRLPGFKPRGDDTPEEREANRREGEELLGVVLEAAGETTLIGEDLGIVPPYVRPSLTSLGIAGFKIPVWEPDPATEGRSLVRPENYARLSLATYGTHDHEPLGALWNRWERAVHGLEGDAEEAWTGLHRLADFADLPAKERSAGFTHEVRAHLLEALFRTNSWIAVCMISDYLGTAERFNVPGTATDSNWSRRLHLTVEGLRGDPATAEWTARIREMIRRTGR